MTTKKFKKAKIGIMGGIGLLLLVILLTLLFLIDHLFGIRTIERLKQVEDYTDFILSYESAPSCDNEIFTLYQTETEIYNGVCINKVFVHYGKTKISLKEALAGKYITLKDITKKMSNVDEIDNGYARHYQYVRSNKENENYRLTLQKKDYQTIKLNEITFEK